MIRLQPVAAVVMMSSLLLFPALGSAQSGDDGGTLYFPPKLTVNYQFSEGEPVLGITETVSRSTTFLIPVIFFDHPGDWSISPRYQLFSGAFTARDYADTNPVRQWNPMGKYYEILNIIGFRLREHPGTGITIRGGYSTEPGETPEVGSARADVVREYLTTIWGIAPQRITVLPPQRMCDSAEHIFRRQEARNVMIVEGDWEILKPVEYAVRVKNIGSLYLRFTIDPYIAPEEVAEIEIVMAADDKVIGRAAVPGSPDSTLYQLQGMWWRTGAQTDNEEEFSSISVEAYVRMHDGRIHRSNTKKISVQTNRYDIGDQGASPIALTLPFFPYGDSLLTGYHRALINRFMEMRTSGEQLALEIMGTADFSEDPETDPADIADYAGLTSSQQEGTLQEMTFQEGQLVLWGSRGSLVDDDDSYLDSDARIYEEYAAESGSEADTATETREEHRFTSDSLAMARTRVVERYLRDSLKVNFVTFDQLPGRTRSVGTTLELLPEERWLARSVVLVVYPYSRFAEQQELMEEITKRARDR